MSRKSERGDTINQTIGIRIQELRIAKGWSRQQLASKIGVTHQQLQKYEKGFNRISADRLVYIAEAFKVDESFFFIDILNKPELTVDNMLENQRTRLAIEVSRNILKIKCPILQNLVNTLARTLAEKGN